MIKKTFLILILVTTISNYSLSAGTNSSGSNNYYEQALPFIKAAKKYEAKGKIEKAKKRYTKALKILLKSNKAKPLQADTLNYLGFTSRKLGDYKNGEKYYLLGLKVNPNHKGINEYLGELYVATNRLDLAKERLNVLKDCNCEEYQELKDIIEGTKKSKY
tara:strand:- start:2 stop:484 length:483 start_codon:yes stop_codon:yes gene_type:complete